MKAIINMRSTTFFVATLTAILAMSPPQIGFAASLQAMDAQTLNGWRQFKFGMTLDQVLALPPPGQPWMRLKVLEAFTLFRGLRSLTSPGPVKEFGADFGVVTLTTSTDKGLEVIMLHSEEKLSAEDCQK